MSRLFISYSRADGAIVKKIVKRLRDLSFDIWIDTGVIGGRKFNEEIAKAIAECDFFLLFISTNSMSSDYIVKEVDVAHEKDKKIILLRLDDVLIPSKLSMQLAGIQWINAQQSREWFSQLLIALGSPSTSYTSHPIAADPKPKASSTPSTVGNRDLERTYLQINVEWVEASVFAIRPQSFKDMLISFLTIRDYRYMLFDPKTNLVHITEGFVIENMLPDLSTVLLKLQDYDDNDRKGGAQAYELIDLALRKLYKGYKKNNGLLDSIMDCRQNINKAYQHLEHWNKYVASLPPKVK